jgi:uncharacterized membrane protein
MPLLGIVIGFIVGAIALNGVGGGVAGGLVGFIIALAIRTNAQTKERTEALRTAEAGAAASGRNMAVPGTGKVAGAAAPAAHDARTGMDAASMVPGDDPPVTRAILQRLEAIDRRLERLETKLEWRTWVAPAAAANAVATPAPTAAPATSGLSIGELPAPAVQPESLLPAMPSTTGPSLTEAPSPHAEAAPTDVRQTPRPATAVPASPPPPSRADVPAPPPAVAPNPLWAWFTGGNALTRIGVVVLFFGVGFLLKYFAEYITIPIEWRLSGVALAGVALIALGMKLAGRRPGYGLSLQGAGAGILYLTTFAAFRFYEVLPATAAFALLAAVAALTVWLAVRNDSQPLAGLAIAGGFLAPFLVGTHAGEPALLFGYFAVLNGAIFALAWVRAWRALNALGFVFTFVLGLLWGHRYYAPAHFATVEPFLILFFLFYVAIAVLYAKKGPLAARVPVDALLVFGVPLVGFALQAGLVRDERYGVAWSAFGVAAVYAMSFVALRKRAEPGLRLLSRTFLVLAVIFGTIAIPFAADPRWTSAWWALEAAGVYWIGCEQRHGLARAFALLLQFAAAVAFVLGGLPEGETMFLNASFLGTTLIALAGLATAFVADRGRDRISAAERSLVPLVFWWGIAWWMGGGVVEIFRQMPQGEEANAMLAWVTGSSAAALLLRRWLRWARLAWAGAALLPAIALVAFKDWHHARTTLLAYGWLIWPIAWATHWRVLRAGGGAMGADAASPQAPAQRVADFLHAVHALSAIALVAWSAWEASEWVGRTMPAATVWMACAAAWPAIAYLGVVVRHADSACWPFTDHRDAYTTSAGTTVAALLAVWFAIVNVVSPGSVAPLPYLPVVNPLDVTLVATLAALLPWARRFGRIGDRALYAWLGAAIFLFINAIVFRATHQIAGVPWRLGALLASKPLQAALTLTWTVTALPLMVFAGKRGIRPLWMVGAALLAVVVGKLFLIDLASLSGLPRVVAFLGVGVLLLLIGYLAPLPPAAAAPQASAPE